MDFQRPDDLTKFYREWTEQAQLTRLQVSRSIGIAQCYFIGAQWIQSGIPIPTVRNADGTNRLRTDWNPDSTRLRVTVNRIPKYVAKAAAATHPENLEVECVPYASDTGVEAMHRAGIVERLANCSVDYANLLTVAQDANFQRCIAGCWGIGFYLADGVMNVGGERVPTRTLKAFDFNPARLILDPAVTNRNLWDHETVAYEDVWTAQKVARVFGVRLDEDKLQTIGQLTLVEQQVNMLSQNQLYMHYRTHSKTKGTRVAQVHRRTPDGRFGLMYVMYQDEQGEWKSPNFENPVSPFGGDGLPFFVLHGYRRPQSFWSIGEASLTKDDQDRLNLLGSLMFRQLQKNAGHFWLVDKRAFPKESSKEAIAGQFSNQVGNVVVYESRSEKGIPPPQLQQYPAPQPFLMEADSKYEEAMRDMTTLTAANLGLGAKSHVPFQTTARMLEEAGQVLGIRVGEDKALYVRAARCATGTILSLAQQENPGTLSHLVAKGFTPDEFRVLLNVDPYELGCDLDIRESSIRYRSIESRKQDLNDTLVARAITPMQFRTEQAALDTATTGSDRQMYAELTRKTDRLIRGEPWRPLPLGEYNEMALTFLRRALFDKRVRDDEAATARVMQAITLQLQAHAMEVQLASPEQPEVQSDQTQGGAPQAQPVSASLGDFLSGSIAAPQTPAMA